MCLALCVIASLRIAWSVWVQAGGVLDGFLFSDGGLCAVCGCLLFGAGVGTYGEVRYARDVATQRSVAVKIVDLGRFRSDAATTMKKEIAILKQTKHEHIISIIDVKGTFFLLADALASVIDMWRGGGGGELPRCVHTSRCLLYECMYVCMYVWMYVCMCVCMYVCLYVGRYVCICVYVCA